MYETHTLPRLADRERQILELASEGLTDQAVAHKLGISLATVGTYWGRIRIKMGPLNRAELVAHFVRAASDTQMSDLRRENEELNQRIQALQSTEFLRSLQAVIDTSDDAVTVVDDRSVIRLANPMAEQVFGGPIVGRKVEELIPAELRHVHAGHHQSYYEAPERKRMGEHRSLLGLRLDGTTFSFSATLNFTPSPLGDLVTCVLREVEASSTNTII